MARKTYLDQAAESFRDTVYKRPAPDPKRAPDPKVKRQIESDYDGRPHTEDDVD